MAFQRTMDNISKYKLQILIFEMDMKKVTLRDIGENKNTFHFAHLSEIKCYCRTVVLFPVKICRLYWFNKTLIGL